MVKLWLLSVWVVVFSASLNAADSSPLGGRDALTYFKFKTHLESLRHYDGGEDASPVVSGFTCDTCKVFFSAIRYLFDAGFVRDEIVKLSVDICEALKIEDDAVCSGVIPLFKDEILTVFDKVGLSSDEACNIVVGASCGKGYDPWHQKWDISIPGDKPPVVHHAPKPNSPTTGVLHITDIHYDPLYTPGLTHECGEPLCCRIPNAPGRDSDGV
jgi:sphingomyelin phosphodiesterase